MLLHAIDADHALQDLSLASKFNTEWTFLTDLKERGPQGRRGLDRGPCRRRGRTFELRPEGALFVIAAAG